VGAQCQPGLGRHPETGGHPGLHHDHVIGAVADPGLEPGVGAQGEQVAAASLAAGDPCRVAQAGQPGLATRRQQVDRIVEQGMQAHPDGLGLRLVVAEDDRDLDLAGAQQLERVERMRVGHADLQARMRSASVATAAGTSELFAGREGGEATRRRSVPRGGELGAGGIDAAADLGGAGGEQLPGRGWADPAAVLAAGAERRLGLEAGRGVG
jgi:hypothetical protein